MDKYMDDEYTHTYQTILTNTQKRLKPIIK